MNATAKTVREIALENPASIRVFEQYGIDYCCGGRKPLSEACDANKVAVDEVIAALERAAVSDSSPADDWNSRSLESLASHIVERHHGYVRKELPRLSQFASKVVNRHGDTKPELAIIQSKLTALGEELLQHCMKEELILFPYVTKLERAVTTGSQTPKGCFGTVANPIAMMTQEHDDAGALLADIRKLSHGFTPPEGACPTFRGFYAGLNEFEQDLHRHIHLENNILFPRAIALEASAS